MLSQSVYLLALLLALTITDAKDLDDAEDKVKIEESGVYLTN